MVSLFAFIHFRSLLSSVSASLSSELKAFPETKTVGVALYYGGCSVQWR